MSHPTPQQILCYLHGECSQAEAERLQQHFTACSACRTEADAEGEFDRRLRRAFPSGTAPADLMARIRRGIDSAATEEGLRRSVRNARAALAVAATVALVCLLALADPAGLLSGRAIGQGATVMSAASLVRGHLVCLGCARLGIEMASHRQCLKPPGDREHVTGLQAADGTLWRFAENEAARPLLAESQLRGRQVELEARAYPEIGYLGVVAVHHL